MLRTLILIRALIVGVMALILPAQPSPHPATDEVGAAVDLKTAKAIGPTIPTSLLPRAE